MSGLLAGLRAVLTLIACAGFALESAHSAGPVLSFDFSRQIAPWVVLGDGARVEAGGASVDGGSPKAVLAYRYEVGKGRLHLLGLPVTNGQLARTRTLSFLARPSDMVSLVITIEEQGGGRWTAATTLAAGRWSTVRLSTGDFVLASESGDPVDSNGLLDMDRVKLVSVVDAAALVAASSPDSMRLFGIKGQPRNVLLADFEFLASDAPQSAPTASSLDGFAAVQPMWMLLGVDAFSYGASGPLTSRGLSVSYERSADRVTSMMRRLQRGALSGASGLKLEIASAAKTTLLVKLELASGAKFEAPVQLSGGSTLRQVALQSADFKRSDDSRKGADRLEWGDITQLTLLDVGGLLSMRGPNQLWLAKVSSNTPSSATVASDAPAQARATATTTSVATPGWSTWTKRTQPIHTGPVSLVGDPSVVRDGSMLRMIYNCFDPVRKRGAVCQATSNDGYTWADVPNKDVLPGRMIKTRARQWDDAHETPFLIKFGSEYLVYFIGYRDKGGFFKSFPAHVGLAVSTDGVNFERPVLDPVVQTTRGGYDADSISSPSVVQYKGKLVMLYSAHCWTTCPQGVGMSLMSATSTDGRNWIKGDKPVLTKADFPKVKDGIAEAEVSQGPDGQYYLFFTLFYGDGGHEIGVARAPSPFGPWDINPEAIVRKSKSGFDSVGPVAPSVVFDGDRVRMWFHGFSSRNTIEIGYAEAPWPLRLK